MGHLAGGCSPLLGFRPEGLALPSDCDPCTSGEVQVRRDLVGSADVIGDAESDHLWHPSLGTVPVHLEPFGVPLVQVIRGDEIEADAVRVGADTGDNHGRETGLRMGTERLGGVDEEIVG